MKHPKIKVAHILSSPLQNHGGLNLLVRELVVGLAPYFDTVVISPQGLSNPPLASGVKDACQRHPWPDNSTLAEIETHIRGIANEKGIDFLIFHGGEFGWGSCRGRKSMMRCLSDLPAKKLYVNHQSSPWFRHLPSVENPSVKPTLTSAISFIRLVFLKHLQLAKTDLEICVSKAETRQARKRYYLFRKKINLIYHSRICNTNIQNFNPHIKRKIILAMGHFAYRKGQHTLIEAFGKIARNHPEWSLKLVGGSDRGEYWEYMQKIVRHHDIADQIKFVTETSDPDIHFEHASIFVQPSLEEAYGLALQEAMSFGCACIGSNVGGIPDSIENRSFLFPPGNSDELASILERLMRNGQLLADAQKECRASFLAHKRTYENMIAEYRRTIENIH